MAPAPTSAPDAAPLTIVALGDSITQAGEVPPPQRWTALLEACLASALPGRSLRVINAGVGGNTSREALARVERDVIPHRPDILLIELGGNDATLDLARAVPLEEFFANLAAIVAHARSASPTCAVIILTFSPVVDRCHTWGTNPNFGPAGGLDRYVERYRKSARAFATLFGHALADIDIALRADLDRHILPDGVHLTAEGNRVLADAILPVALAPLATGALLASPAAPGAR